MAERADDDRSPEGELGLPPEEMRRLGYRVVDILVDRATGLPGDRAWDVASRRETEGRLREPPPEDGRAPEEVLERAIDDVLPLAGRIDHPRFFAFVPSSPTWPAVLGDFLATGYNVFQGTWLESAGPSQVELVVLEWFRSWLGLPEGAGGLLTSGGSAANLIALAAARIRRLDAEAGPEGTGRGVVYLGDQAHSSVERAARIVGIPEDGLRRVPSDDAFRMRPAALERAIRDDRRAGRIPVAACASAGATNTGACDPLDEVGAVCRGEGVWLHVDAAYGGFAALTEEGARTLEGIGEADTVTLDPHKWLFQPYEAGCLIARDPGELEEALRVMPEYLQDVELGFEEVNFADRGLQLTRRFRALKIWFSVHVHGVGAYRSTIRRALELAEAAEARIREAHGLELLTPAALGVVCYRVRPAGVELGEEALASLNERVQAEVNESGWAMLSSTRLRGTYALRLCIMNHRTRWPDVEETLRRVEEAGACLARSSD